VRFGFIGAGGIARSALAPAVHAADGAVLQAVAARDADRARALEPAGAVHTDYRALLDDPDVDVVYISLSNESHAPWTVAALEAGKHVLCEKPLGLDPAEVERMAQAAAATGRLLVEAFWYRWHPRTRRLEQLLAEGALGPVRHVDAEFSFAGSADPRLAGNFRMDPARGGGALYDVGCYALSAVHLALGGEVTVLAATGSRSPQGVDLDADVRLRADGGLQAGATAAARCGIWEADRQTLRVEGEGARVEFPPGDAFTNRAVRSSLTITTPDGAVRVEEFAPVDPYRLMAEAVAQRVRGGSAFVVPLEHSRQVAASTSAALATLPRP